MTLFQNKYRIESARLQGWDYSKQAAYFVTIVLKNREWLFGEIVDDNMIWNDAGRRAQQCWADIPKHFPHVMLDVSIVMPNHVHGIIFITESGTVGTVVPPVSPVPPVETQNFASLHMPTNMPPPISSQMPYKNCFGPQSRNLASIVRGFKIGVTNWFRKNNNYNMIWQACFHDHIIRNDASYQKISNYIVLNPENWQEDIFYKE